MKDFKAIYYPESRFGGFSNIDGTLAFYHRVNSLINQETTIIDIGCGRGAYREDPVPYRRKVRTLKGKCASVIGIDVDSHAQENPFLDEFRLITGETWPVEDEAVDLCLADNVLEHIETPDRFFYECHRILKPDGYLCIRTPNLLSYVGLISRLVPNQQHVKVLSKVKDKILVQDIFPTYHRCNTIPNIRKKMTLFGFDACVYGYEAEPAYHSFSQIFYALGVFVARFTPNLFKVGIHAFGQKQR